MKQERHRPCSLRRGPGGLTLFPRFQSSASLIFFEVLVTSNCLASGGLLRVNQHGQYLPFAGIRVLHPRSGQIIKLATVCPGDWAGSSPRILVQMTPHPIRKSQVGRIDASHARREVSLLNKGTARGCLDSSVG